MENIKVKVFTDGYVYCLHDEHNGICRIGKTDLKATGRIKSQVSYCPFPLHVFQVQVKNITETETALHRFFKSKKHKGDWYKIAPNEFLDQVKIIKKGSSKQLNYRIEEVCDYAIERHMGNKRWLKIKTDPIKKIPFSITRYVKPSPIEASGNWWIILPEHRELCPLVSISLSALLLRVNYRGKEVKIKINNITDYKIGLSGREIEVTALSPKGRNFNKKILIAHQK